MFQSPHIRLLATDFPTSFRFYQDTLGLTSRFNLDDVYAEFDITGQTLALYQRTLMAEVVGKSGETAEGKTQDAAMLVLSTEDVDTAARQLRAAGVTLVTEPQDRPEWGLRTAHFRDPDGQLIEINCPMLV